jgi:tetraprenyl-beta-curcumene synthase
MTPASTAPVVTDAHTAPAIDRLGLAASFTRAAQRYWTGVFPRVRRECRHWREEAGEIPDPVLRALALQAQEERGNLEGAAAFAAFVPRAHRAAVVRALVSYQSTYNYLDVLAEQPGPNPVAGARGLHQALLDSLDPGAPDTDFDYYADYPQRDDGGYLAELVAACRTALATLPSYAAVAPAALRATERIVEFQSLNLSEGQGEHDAFERWACAQTPAGADLEWWETAAAGGSSLGVYALIAAAAAPVLPASEVHAIESAYFPSIGALHSLLDHLVDRGEDAAAGQRNLIDYYPTTERAAERMWILARRAALAAEALPQADHRHTIVLAAMTANYLSDPAAAAPATAPIARTVTDAIGALIAPSLLVFKARALAGELASASWVSPPERRTVSEHPGPTVALRTEP